MHLAHLDGTRSSDENWTRNVNELVDRRTLLKEDTDFNRAQKSTAGGGVESTATVELSSETLCDVIFADVMLSIVDSSTVPNLPITMCGSCITV